MSDAALYIDQAIKYQESANEKLAPALRVTTQATELEYIVQQLTDVVGAQDTDISPDNQTSSTYARSNEVI